MKPAPSSPSVFPARITRSFARMPIGTAAKLLSTTKPRATAGRRDFQPVAAP